LGSQGGFGSPYPITVLLAAAAVIAFGVASALTAAFRRAAFAWGFLDRPNERSSHEGIVPRGGGAALVLAVVSGLAVASGTWQWGPGVVAVLAGLALMSGVGLWDDRWGLSPWSRLLFQVIAAAAVVWAAGGLESAPLPPPLDVPLGLGPALAVFWIVTVINFYNFLDGIDGLAGVQGLITGAGLALAGWDPFSAACGAAVAGACGGFLLHNWAPARIFMGDVGSGALGFLLASAPLLAPGARSRSVLFMAVSLWLFLADATWTLARRVARGERWHQAHREHLYQRLVAQGWSHARVTTLIGLGSLVLTLLALWAWRSGDTRWWWLSLAAAVVFFGIEIRLTRLRTPAGG